MIIEKQIIAPSRRSFMSNSSRLMLSAGAIAMLGNVTGAASAAPMAAGDLSILNVAVGLEYEGINAYTLALKSGLLDANVTKAATKFRDDHMKHNEALIATIRKMHGEPVGPKTEAEYAKALKFDELKNQNDIRSLAARLEMGAANAYLGVIPALKDPQLAKVAARLAADEASHWTLLNFDLGRPFGAALSFGA
jgi:rubrerythrin